MQKSIFDHVYLIILVLITIALISGIWLVMLRRLVSKRTRELTEKNEKLQQVRDGLDKTVAERTAELSSLNAELLSEIAERGRMEVKHREREAFIRLVLDNLPIGIAVNSVDPAVSFDYINDKFPAYYRTTKEKLADPDTFWDAVYEDPEFREEMKKRVLDDCASGDPTRMYWADVPITRKGDETAFISARNIPLPARKLMISTVWDVTERKKAEEALRVSEERLRLAVYGGSVGIWEWDVATNKLDWNDQLKAIFGLPVSTTGLTLEQFMSAIYHDDLADTEHAFRSALEQHAEFKHEYRIVWPDGNVHWIVAIGRGFYDLEGLPVRMLGCALDITERRQTDEALRLSEESFRSIVSTSQEWIWAIDSEGRHIFSNPAIEKILGYHPDEIVGQDALHLLHEEDLSKVEQLLPGCIKQKTGWTNLVLRWKHRDGTCRYLESNAVPILDSAGDLRGFQGSDRDITERKHAEEEKERLQAQLLQAQKMEAVGHLAGGVAHDFNNILSAIVGYAHITLMKMKDDDPLRSNLEHILASSEKAANLTKSLLAFSRKQIMQMKTVNINGIVSGMITILDRIIGEDIYLQVNTAVHDLIVNVDTNQIEQVIMNLATNARDAMQHGGTLSLTTEETEIDENYIRMHQEGEVGKYAALSVTDTGMGMDEKTRENIFDPFFTTKEVGKGTGLGLAMIYGTIKQHNGFINVYSEQGKGTTIKVYLPLAEQGIKNMEEKKADPISSGTETILVVEDDENVRIVTRAFLEEYGYSVIEAADGKRAVELFRENRDRIHLVITDIIMPGQSGKDLHNELMKIAAGIKIIFISGYPADVLAKKGIIDSNVNFISKPVNPEILLKKIREVLEK